MHDAVLGGKAVRALFTVLPIIDITALPHPHFPPVYCPLFLHAASAIISGFRAV